MESLFTVHSCQLDRITMIYVDENHHGNFVHGQSQRGDCPLLMQEDSMRPVFGIGHCGCNMVKLSVSS